MVEAGHQFTGRPIPETEFRAKQTLSLDFVEDADFIEHLQSGRVRGCGSRIVEQLAVLFENYDRDVGLRESQRANQTDGPGAGDDDLIDIFVIVIRHPT
jgi:hypothetical protein